MEALDIKDRLIGLFNTMQVKCLVTIVNNIRFPSHRIASHPIAMDCITTQDTIAWLLTSQQNCSISWCSSECRDSSESEWVGATSPLEQTVRNSSCREHNDNGGNRERRDL